MIEGKSYQPFYCRACRRIVKRKVHGNLKTISSYCDRTSRTVILRRRK